MLREFYGPFKEHLDQAEHDLEGVRLKVPDEVSDEVCDVCGRQMVIKSGRFGRFLACPGYPECTFTKPLVIAMPGRCPKCGGRILKKTSRNGYAYYGCEHNSEKDESKRCDFMTWDVPVADDCPVCGRPCSRSPARGSRSPSASTRAVPTSRPKTSGEAIGRRLPLPPLRERGLCPSAETKKTATSTKKSASSTKKSASATKKAASTGKKASSTAKKAAAQ